MANSFHEWGKNSSLAGKFYTIRGVWHTHLKIRDKPH
jgi:hypothetical protein